MVTRIGNTSRDCHTFRVNVLRLIIVSIHDLCTVSLQTISTDSHFVIEIDHSTDLTSITNATINIGVVDVCNSRVFDSIVVLEDSRVVLLRIVSTNLDHIVTTESGTDLGPTTNYSVEKQIVSLSNLCILTLCNFSSSLGFL